MKTSRRNLVAGGLIAAAVPAAAFALLAQPHATGAADPCAASEVAKTVGSVAKSMGDYLDAHPDTNLAMTSVLQQQAGPQSVDSLKTYFTANPKVALDFQSITAPLQGLSTQCKLPISLPQAMGLMQQAQSGAPGGPAPSGGIPASPLPGPPRANRAG